MNPQDYLQAVRTLLDKGETPHKVAEQLKSFLARRRSLYTLGDIVRAYDQEVKFGYNPEVLKIETAQEVSPKTLGKIKQHVGADTHTDTRHSVSPSHLGGFKAMYRNTLIDMTLENKLQALRNHLLKI